MSQVTVSLIIALLSAVVSIATALASEMSRRHLSTRLADQQTRHERELVELSHRLRVDHEANAKIAEAKHLVERYRDPLLLSAHDLQSRIFNVLRPHGFRGRRHPDYFRLSTLFVIADFFGWLEIIRREKQFMDLGAEQDTRALSNKLSRVQDIFASTSSWDDEFYLYRAEQRAVGELMVIKSEASGPGAPSRECLGYATFVSRMDDPEFAGWFARLGSALAALPGHQSDRLAAVQNALIELIDFLDPGHQRLTDRRERLIVPEAFEPRQG